LASPGKPRTTKTEPPSSSPAAGYALIALGLSISLAHLAVTTIGAAIALQALLAAQLGVAIGATIGAHWRERAEQSPESS
jgi:hypothetical protein